MSQHVVIDRGLLREIDEQELLTNPYLELATLVEKVGCLKGYLRDAAAAREYRTYGQVTGHCNIHPTRRGLLLGFLGLHEDGLGNPPLPAVVVSERDGRNVGSGYFRMVEKAQHLTDDVPDDEAKRDDIWRRHSAAVFDEWGP